jgi:hypothetical protein
MSLRGDGNGQTNRAGDCDRDGSSWRYGANSYVSDVMVPRQYVLRPAGHTHATSPVSGTIMPLRTW